VHETAEAATVDNVTEEREKVLLFGQCPKKSLNKNRITSDFDTIYRKLGVRIKEVAREDLITRYQGLNEQESTEAVELTEELIAGAKQFGRPRPATPDILKGVRFYVAMREMMKEQKADAANIVCFSAPGMPTPCVALTFLLDRGILAACQCDLDAFLTMILFKRSVGRVSFMGNVSANNRLLAVSHCVLSRAMKDQTSPQPYYIGNHHGRRPGPTIHTDLAPGEPVTIARLTRNLGRLVIAEGRVRGSFDWSRPCRNTLVIQVRNLPRLMTFVRNNQHHLVVAYGHAAREMSAEAVRAGIKVVAV
jgi:L-fucose isomerase-like protein